MRKTTILRERLIEDAERMREIYSAIGRDVAIDRRTPSRAREIAETIQSKQRPPARKRKYGTPKTGVPNDAQRCGVLRGFFDPERLAPIERKDSRGHGDCGSG